MHAPSNREECIHLNTHRRMVGGSDERRGQITRYPLPVSELPESGSKLSESEVSDAKFG